MMRNVRKSLAAFLLPLALVAGAPAARAADAPAPVAAGELPGATFTDSTAAGLAGTRRVAITSVVIAFQASTGARAGAHFFIPTITSRKEVQTVLALPGMSADLQGAIAEAAYKALAAELAGRGFEVVPEAQVKASANYQAILAQAGYTNNSRFANAMGDVVLSGPASLPPYTAYQGEIGLFQYPSTTYLGWMNGFGGKSQTPGGPSIMTQGNAWKVPGLEVALAKELNAHVVKAYYVVSLGKAEAKRSTSFTVTPKAGLFTYNGSVYQGFYNERVRTVTGSGNAFAQVGLVADQSHIAFRTPTGNAKWQKVSMMKVVPPKDGDVVLRLASPVMGGTDWFSISEGDIDRAGGLFSAQKRADLNIGFIATINDELGYGAEVTGMIDSANQAMLALVQP